MFTPKVLVLLAAYNGSSWIVRQIETILNQANVEVRLVVSDDGSSDDTRARIALFERDSRVLILPAVSPTGAAAQNFFRLIRDTPLDEYTVVAFADQDDIWNEDKLYRACLALQNEDAGGYSSAVTAFWEDGRTKALCQHSVLTDSDFLFEGAGQGCTFVLAGTFYRRVREFFLQNQGQTERLHYHDWAIYALARSWKVDWVFDPKPTMLYRQHSNNDTGARTSLSGMNRRVSLIREGWYLEQLYAIAEICFTASPSDPVIARWRGLLGRPRGLARTYAIARFCLHGGRRRLFDRGVVVGAAILGWI
ncbi:MAG: glycosyltransferase [Pseudomonadota bacterium]|nr:glycosyltransferase [Pseudomonadota bacterium]